jgi:hypothetical protein
MYFSFFILDALSDFKKLQVPALIIPAETGPVFFPDAGSRPEWRPCVLDHQAENARRCQPDLFY